MSPERRPLAWDLRRASAIVAACALCGSAAFGQNVTEPSLKAAFIYNFAKFTEWPQDALPVSARFVACVLGDGPVGIALERTTAGRLLAGRTVSVSHIAPGGSLQSCHLLYVSGFTGPQAVEILTPVRGLPVLTISDIDNFTALNGIAHMFVENGTMRFELNFGVAKRSRLQLSSKLLSLASRVFDGPERVER